MDESLFDAYARARTGLWGLAATDDPLRSLRYAELVDQLDGMFGDDLAPAGAGGSASRHEHYAAAMAALAQMRTSAPDPLEVELIIGNLERTWSVEAGTDAAAGRSLGP